MDVLTMRMFLRKPTVIDFYYDVRNAVWDNGGWLGPWPGG